MKKDENEQIAAISKILGPDVGLCEKKVVPFGKHAGQTLGEIADSNLSYLRWLGIKCGVSRDLGIAARVIIKDRMAR